MKNIGNLLVIVPLIILGIILTGCPEPEPPVGVVTVYEKNESGANVPVDGAWVRVEPASPGVDYTHVIDSTPGDNVLPKEVLKFEKQTDASGRVSFDFKYPAIIAVTAWAYVSNNDSIVG
ncbi:MAG: hypothetical protein C0594_11140, partial [Marinilabiliales bacterium]